MWEEYFGPKKGTKNFPGWLSCSCWQFGKRTIGHLIAKKMFCWLKRNEMSSNQMPKVMFDKYVFSADCKSNDFSGDSK